MSGRNGGFAGKVCGVRGKIAFVSFVLIFAPLTALSAEPSVQDCLDSWKGHSLSEVCDHWSILPDKTLEISPGVTKVEFNYTVQNTENGAYIPGEDVGIYDATKNAWVKIGTKDGTYQKVTVTHSCKVVVTLEKKLIVSSTYSGDESALRYFTMEPTQYAAYKEELGRMQALANQGAKPTYRPRSGVFYSFGLGVEYSGKVLLTTGFFLPAIDFPVYPSLDLCLEKDLFNKSRYGIGAQIMANIGTGRPDPSEDGDLYLSSGIGVHYIDGNLTYGFPIRAGLRYPPYFDLYTAVTLSPVADPSVMTAMQIFLQM